MTPEEVAAVIAAHAPYYGTPAEDYCSVCSEDSGEASGWPCLPYRLAEALDAARASRDLLLRALNENVAVLEADHIGHHTSPVETTYLRECLDCEVTYDATPALADQPEQAANFRRSVDA